MNPLQKLRGWGELPRSFQTLLTMGALMIVFLIFDQQAAWQQREDYYFGFLVPVFVYFVLEDRWKKILPLFQKRGSSVTDPQSQTPTILRPFIDLPALPMIALVGGAALFLLGGLIRAVEGSSAPASLALNVGFIFTFYALLLLATRPKQLESEGYQPVPWKERFLLMGFFVFPVFIWLLSAPMVGAVESRISIFLLNIVTIVVYHSFNFLGFAIEQQGNTLILPLGQVGVAEACSGIRSLMACLFAGSVMGALYLNTWWKKAMLVGAAMFLAFVMNLFRSIFLTAWAYAYGSEAIEGMVHDVTGYAVLGLTCIGLFILLPFFTFKVPDHLPDEEPATS